MADAILTLRTRRIEDRHPAPQLIKKDDKGKLFALPSEPGVTPSPIYPGLRTNLPKVRLMR